jgi:hypothetical protein
MSLTIFDRADYSALKEKQRITSSTVNSPGRRL